jgi:triphosphoribosyl-dephospho-CoA synthase
MEAWESLTEGVGRTGKRIALAAQAACLLEVSAPKPGNVNRQYDFRSRTSPAATDLRFEDFLLSAVAIGPAMGAAGRCSVGRTVLRAIRATRRLVRTNTNLGIVLLLAPLAKAYSHLSQKQRTGLAKAPIGLSLRNSLSAVLADLTVADASQIYAAIRLAKAGGLGRVVEADVNEEPVISFLEAMRLAQDRDSLAKEYASGYSITLGIGYPVLNAAYSAGGDLTAAIVQAYLTILAQVPDTLIARKCGREAAVEVSGWAAEALTKGGALALNSQEILADLDLRLRRPDDHSLNPGTSADLTAAAVFLFLLIGRDQVL